jgi:hypothetical protein
MVAPVLGIPLAVKFALNQITFPPLIGVPLKLEALPDAGHDWAIVSGANRAMTASRFRWMFRCTT